MQDDVCRCCGHAHDIHTLLCCPCPLSRRPTELTVQPGPATHQSARYSCHLPRSFCCCTAVSVSSRSSTKCSRAPVSLHTGRCPISLHSSRPVRGDPRSELTEPCRQRSVSCFCDRQVCMFQGVGVESTTSRQSSWPAGNVVACHSTHCPTAV